MSSPGPRGPAEPASGEVPLPEGRVAGGIGLRAQILLALLVGLGLSTTLIAIAVDQLASRALEAERARSAEVAAHAAAAMIGGADASSQVLDRAEAGLLRPSGAIGLALVRDDGSIEQRGVTGEGVWAEAPVEGGHVRAWVSSAARGSEERGSADGASAALVRLVVLYASMTALAMLVLCYVLLTRLIVRPVEALTLAAERLARGRGGTRGPLQGAAEVQRLALSLDAMGRDLARERASLEARLRELEDTTRELTQAQDSLVRSEKLASVGRLSAGIAHEIGNPLAAILGLVELVRGGGLSEAESQEFLGRIQAETERIHRILRDLLDFARLSPDGEKAGASSDLAEVVDGAVQLVRPQKDLRRLKIERAIDAALPRVRGDADALTQVVLNLLLNATDATAGEGTIRMIARVDDDAVELAVEDSGPGVPLELRERIFEPFVTTKPVGAGTGLGLAVCWTIVERLGGSIRVGDADGGGARFVVRLPAA